MSDSKAAQAILAVATAPPQKSGGVAAALWFFLAGFGGPWWYLGRPGTAIGVVLLYLFCGLLIFAGVGLILVPIVWILDLLSVFSTLKTHNREREQLLRAALAS